MSAYEGIMKALTDLRFWDQIQGDAKRTLAVHPDQAEQVRAAASEAGLDDMLTVLASPIVPPDQAYVIDTPAMEAYERQSLQGWRPFWEPRKPQQP